MGSYIERYVTIIVPGSAPDGVPVGEFLQAQVDSYKRYIAETPGIDPSAVLVRWLFGASFDVAAPEGDKGNDDPT